MDNNTYLPEFLEGKTIKLADIGIEWIGLYFTDGSSITIKNNLNHNQLKIKFDENNTK